MCNSIDNGGCGFIRGFDHMGKFFTAFMGLFKCRFQIFRMGYDCGLVGCESHPLASVWLNVIRRGLSFSVIHNTIIYKFF
jgi:hypothetical protein